MSNEEVTSLSFDLEVDISDWETDVAIKVDTAHLNSANLSKTLVSILICLSLN